MNGLWRKAHTRVSRLMQAWPAGIRTKLVVPFIVFMGIVSTFIFLHFPSQEEDRMMEDLRGRAQSVAGLIAESMTAAMVFEDTPTIVQECEAAKANKEFLYVAAIDAHDRVVHSVNPGGIDIPRAGVMVDGGRISRDGMMYETMAPIMHNDREIGYVLLGFSLSGVRDRVGQGRLAIAIISIVVFLFGTIVVLAISTVVTGVMSEMVFTAQLIEKGDLARRAPTDSQDELGWFARSFNRMVETLQVAHSDLEAANEEMTLKARALQQEIVERRQAESALRESEERYRLLFEHNPMPMWLYNAKTLQFLGVNRAAIAHYGYSRNEFLSMSVLDIRPAEDIELLKSKLGTGLQGVQHFGQWRHRTKDGSILEVDVTSYTFELNGRTVRLVLANDVTEKVRTQKILESSEQKHRTLIETMTEGMMSVDTHDVIQFVNPGCCQMLGYDKEDLVGKVAHELITDERGRQLIQEMGQWEHPKGSHQYEMHLRQKSGDEIWVRVSLTPVTDESGKFIGSLRIFTDMSERKRYEERISEQAALLDKARDAIIVLDTDYRIIYWNKSSERVYGWTGTEAQGQEYSTLLPAEDPSRFESLQQQIVQAGEWNGEFQQRRKDGKPVIVEARATLVRDQRSSPKAVLLINTDVTGKKSLEAQFLRSQRLQSLGTLAGGVAHDLNNVLAPILMSTHLLRMRHTDAKTTGLLDTMDSALRRGADIVKQVLTFARGAEGERIIIQPKHLVKEMEKIIKETFPKSVYPELKLGPDLWTVMGDSTQLHQVLMNLCVNARDAMPNGGTLTIGIENTVLDDSYAHLHLEAQPGRYVVLTVADTGTGIPPDVLERIFEPFFTTKDVGKGTGLGLSTVLSIVKGHKGFINVYSEPGKGTQFKIYLPANVTADAEATRPQPADLPRGDGRVVLVVDDEPAVCMITKETLEAFGYKVLVAHDGTEALALYASNSDTVDIVLTDMMMPFMDGSATIRALRRLDPDVKVIAASGLSLNQNSLQDAGTQVLAFLPKPYTAEKLLVTLHEHLRAA